MTDIALQSLQLPWRPFPAPSSPHRALALPASSYRMHVIGSAGVNDAHGAVVMIHGMEESWEVWEPIVPRLESARRLFRLDLPWSGLRGYDWTLDRTSIAQWIKRGLDVVPGPVSALVAHSFGALAAMEYLDVHGTGAIEAAVLVSPFHLERGRELDWQLIDYLSARFLRFLEGALAVRQGRARLDSEISQLMAEKVRDKIGPVGCLEFLNLYFKSRRVDLRRLGIPFLIVGGEDDFYSLPEDCRRLGLELPNASVEILQGCGHFSMIERPDRVACLLDAFLSQNVTGATNRTSHTLENKR